MTTAQGIGAGIIGIAAHVPSARRTNDHWSSEFVAAHLRALRQDVVTCIEDSERPVDVEVRRHAARFAGDPFRGARERRVVSGDETSSDLEVAAAERALGEAGVDPKEVDLLLGFSQVPDYASPGNAPMVADRLGLRRDSTVLTVGAECASLIPQLKTAARMVACEEHRTALIIQASTSSQVLSDMRPNSVNVGDGAVAAVVRAVGDGEGYIASRMETHGHLHASVRLAPDGEPHIPWFRGDRHRAHLVAQSMDVERTVAAAGRAVSFCRDNCLELLKRCGHRASDLDFFVCSQPTAWYGDACAEALGISPDRTLNTFPAFGHAMAASVGLNLFTAAHEGRIQPGDLVLVFAPGAGFVTGAALMRWASPSSRR